MDRPINPEADEIDDEDLEAAANFYDRLLAGRVYVDDPTNPFRVKMMPERSST